MREAVTMTARPTMISAKYRLKEERRRMLKLSVNKLRRIEDPESSLRRSVLINNTVRRLQREQREARNPAPIPCPDPIFADPAPSLPSLLREDDMPAVTATSPATATPTTPCPEAPAAATAATPNLAEELEDVLSQFYMPPTPRMITSIDEDEAHRDAGEDAVDGGAGKRGSSPPRGGSACPVASKRPRLDHRLDRSDADDEGRALALALADPTNTLEDFKDEVCLRTKPRVPLANTNAPLCGAEDMILRTDFCGRRYTHSTHTGHDRENIAPFGLVDRTDSASALVQGVQGVGAAAGAGVVAMQLQHHVQHHVQHSLQGLQGLQGLQSLQPYSCSQAHGQAQATLQSGHGLVFHGLMATMES